MAVNKSYRQLTNRIRYHEKLHGSEWVRQSKGLNFKKIANQIKELKDKGFSYEDQLYALDYIVKNSNDTFFGYTHVYNNIEWIMEKKRQHDKKIEQIENNKKNQVTEQVYDLSSMLDDEEEW